MAPAMRAGIAGHPWTLAELLANARVAIPRYPWIVPGLAFRQIANLFFAMRPFNRI
jgi:hypothetical protein